MEPSQSLLLSLSSLVACVGFVSMHAYTESYCKSPPFPEIHWTKWATASKGALMLEIRWDSSSPPHKLSDNKSPSSSRKLPSQHSVTAARSKTSQNKSQFCQIKLGQNMFASLHPPPHCIPAPQWRDRQNYWALRKREVCCVSQQGCQRRADKRKWVRLLLSSLQSITSPLAPRLR